MTPASSVTFFDSDFQEFLYAPVFSRADELPLSVLSALARLGLDPWLEAAELAQLPIEAATKKLTTLLSDLPKGSWPQSEAAAIVDRLIKLLPRRSYSRSAALERSITPPKWAAGIPPRLLIVAVLAIAVLIALAIR